MSFRRLTSSRICFLCSRVIRVNRLLCRTNTTHAAPAEAAAQPSTPLPYYRTRSKSKLPSFPARTRFAPSPTGTLHLGSLRTALFAFLLARATGGQFILRIEDTDQKRTIPGAEEAIMRDLTWAGLHWDEGPVSQEKAGSSSSDNNIGPYGPYRQSQRIHTNVYRNAALALLARGHAYRCFCTPEMLKTQALARSADGASTEYNGTCLGIPRSESEARAQAGETYVVRLQDPHRSIASATATTHDDDHHHCLNDFEDLVLGTVRPRTTAAKQRAGRAAWNDAILLKSDGQTPTYHLANVVDDHAMRITHVVRGVEWLESTWTHLAIYAGMGWAPPVFAHVGLLLDQSKAKLSKRAGFGLGELRRAVLPQALVNYLATLGWRQVARASGAGGKNSEVWTMEELVEYFDMDLNKSNTVVALGKLFHLQARHVQKIIKENSLSSGTTEFNQEYTALREWIARHIVDNVYDSTWDHFSINSAPAADAQAGISNLQQLNTRIDALLFQQQPKVTTVQDLVDSHRYLFAEPTDKDVEATPVPFPSSALDATPSDPKFGAIAECVSRCLSNTSSSTTQMESLEWWDMQILSTAQQVAHVLNNDPDHRASIRVDGGGKDSTTSITQAIVHALLRKWVTGRASGPSLKWILQILGPEIVRRRVTKGAESYL